VAGIRNLHISFVIVILFVCLVDWSGKRAPVAEINRHSLHPKATMFTKTAIYKQLFLFNGYRVTYYL
ncbi:hypothetical protein JI667_20455, partial [Bacillus sp. NTK074B]|uniref:hypothetical protein n=1 Tax=Bacillus sp. NTK074B TaxID=2802174 RepID=UPI001A8DB9FA|nr:hypothetical protein [Bacillus sp. NTK074B]